ncbi:eukaryotic aspartyl protease family protein [Citrus sinensis]|uniref:Eukaryotic aspartyl protease family protein n=1 Tax=Citrus sinensis TaxID=2711 RepID=A0ACB8JP38_CITSI|nr:eukaryotic aspartyl protease family protein [Citrus sinensis]
MWNPRGLILAVLALLVQVSVVYSVVLPLERAFPLNQPVQLSQLRARDRVRHSRILQGVVEFPVQGSSDPFLIGSSTARIVSCSDPLCASEIQTTATQCPSGSNQCSYSFEYGDGSGTSGSYIYDTLYFDAILGESLIANSTALIVFGCSTYQTGDLSKTDKAIDGIFGFGQGDLSVISQLASRGITPRVFSHCLKGQGNGGENLNSSNAKVNSSLRANISLVLTADMMGIMLLGPHYNLNLHGITVNGQLLSIDPSAFAASNNRETIVDSGTTLTYLVEEAFDPFVSAITATVSQSVTPTMSKGKQCYLVSNSVSDIFPRVSLNFEGGASMVLKPEEYLIHLGFYVSFSPISFAILICKVNKSDMILVNVELLKKVDFDGFLFQDGAAMWCIGFEKSPGGVSILGDLVLKDKIFVYDLARQRVGWANYDCSLSVNVSITSGKDQFMSAGQLSMSSSSIEMLFKLTFWYLKTKAFFRKHQ